MREPYWQKGSIGRIIGDDIKSGRRDHHASSSPTLFGDRGVHLDKTMQLNVGGNLTS
jgi:myo-inositol-1-phosphate synthase